MLKQLNFHTVDWLVDGQEGRKQGVRKGGYMNEGKQVRKYDKLR